MKPTISPADYVLSSAVAFPILYNSVSIDDMWFKVLDQLLNVIGNGISNDEDLVSEFKSIDLDYDKFFAQRLSKGENLMSGYKKVKEYALDENQFSIPVFSEDTIICFESETVMYPDVKVWINNTNKKKISPYPNFIKKYSTVYQTNLVEYGCEWINACIWYYTKCNEFFNSDQVCCYSYAFPREIEKETQKVIQDYKTFMKKYSSNEEISKAYKLEFTGDYEDFAKRAWQKELKRIQQFINETLVMLNNNLK